MIWVRSAYCVKQHKSNSNNARFYKHTHALISGFAHLVLLIVKHTIRVCAFITQHLPCSFVLALDMFDAINRAGIRPYLTQLQHISGTIVSCKASEAHCNESYQSYLAQPQTAFLTKLNLPTCGHETVQNDDSRFVAMHDHIHAYTPCFWSSAFTSMSN